MRADRLLQLLLLLQRHSRLSARDLAERLEVSRRTVMRDMEALSAAGVPVYTERGRNGGCVLMPGYQADVSGLTPKEAQALLAWSGRGSFCQELGLGDALQSAMRKLSAAMPVELHGDAEALSKAIVVDRRRWFDDADKVGALPVLRQAVVARRRVLLHYASASAGKVQSRTVDPWGLVEQAGRWYLIAAHRNEPRMYRVSRIEQADLLDVQAVRPEVLDLQAEWERLRSGLEQELPMGVEVVVRVRPEAVAQVRRITASFLAKGTIARDLPPALGEVAAAGDPGAGWPRLGLSFRVREAARGVLLGMTPDVEVLEPADLRDELRRYAEAAVRLYG